MEIQTEVHEKLVAHTSHESRYRNKNGPANDQLEMVEIRVGSEGNGQGNCSSRGGGARSRKFRARNVNYICDQASFYGHPNPIIRRVENQKP